MITWTGDIPSELKGLEAKLRENLFENFEKKLAKNRPRCEI